MALAGRHQGLRRVGTANTDAHQALIELRVVIDGTLRMSRSIEATATRPVDTSPYAADLNASSSPAWGKAPMETAQSYAAMHAASADDHLAALRRLLEEPLPVLADLTVARGAVESSARTWWCYEPELPSIERLARGMTERLHARWRGRQLRAAMGEAPTDTAVEQRLITAAEGEGLKTFTKGHPWAVGQPRPNVTDLVGRIQPEFGEVAWRWMSAAAHGEAGGLLSRTEPEADDVSPSGWRLEARGRPVSEVATVTAFVLEAHAAANRRRLHYHGWLDDRWEAWVRHCRHVAARFLPSPNE